MQPAGRGAPNCRGAGIEFDENLDAESSEEEEGLDAEEAARHGLETEAARAGNLGDLDAPGFHVPEHTFPRGVGALEVFGGSRSTVNVKFLPP